MFRVLSVEPAWLQEREPESIPACALSADLQGHSVRAVQSHWLKGPSLVQLKLGRALGLMWVPKWEHILLNS